MRSPAEIERAVWQALRTVIDPEIGLDIVTLGLIQTVVVTADQGAGSARVEVVHTLTMPGCPMESHLREGIRRSALSVDGVGTAESRLVFDPPWHPGLIQQTQELDP
jgi:metal-sulfur cluster biosynthetic enzyme